MSTKESTDPAAFGDQVLTLVANGPHDLVALQYGLGYRFRRAAMVSEIRDACQRLVEAGKLKRVEVKEGIVWTV